MRKVRLLVDVVLTGYLMAFACGYAWADEPFSSAPQPLAKALVELADHYDIVVVAPQDVVAGQVAPGIQEAGTADEALRQLLEPSGLRYSQGSPNGWRVFGASQGPDGNGSTGQSTGPRDVDSGNGTGGEDGEPSGTDGADEGAGTDGTPGEDGYGELGELAEIIVTGSRIRQDSLDTPSPVVIFSSDDFDADGAQDVAESLAELPFISQSAGATSDGGNAQSEGLSTINLRALGDNRTLVLIDGRRAVSNSAQSNRVSLSSIPDDLIDRVEILTGGASSIYGSDAIAGVVNIITETGQTGLKVKAVGSITDEDDDERAELTGSWGTHFNDERGYFFVTASYEERWGIKATDRPFALIEADFDYNNDGFNEFNGISPDGGPGGDLPADTFPPNLMRDRSSNFFPGGLFDADVDDGDPLGYFNRGGEFVYFGTELVANDVADRYGETDRIYNNILNPRTRYTGATKFTYEVSDRTEAFGQVLYAREETLSVRRPQDFDDAEDFMFVDPETGEFAFDNGVGDIDSEDPLVLLFGPDELKDPITGEGLGDIDWDRRFDEVGLTQTENERTTVRSWVGLRGDIWEDWQWETSIGYGHFAQDQVRRNELNLRALEEALETEFVDPGNSNEIQCASEEARADGCVPVNLFGVGSISPAAADYIRADLMMNARIHQETFQGFLNGPLFEVPAGTVRAAFGVDYRKDTLHLRNDELSQLGGTTEITIPDTDGSISAYEGFGELSIPLLTQQPLFQQLDLNLSARLAHYDIDTVGTVFTYRGGLSWRPVDDLRFRVQYARAERAPDITELFSPARGDTDSGIIDPCDGVDATTPGTVADNCRASPAIAAAIAEEGVFETDLGSLLSTNEGNINLESETSDSLTAGVVLSPRFAPGLLFSVDYYDVQVDNVIELFDNNLLLRNCYESEASFDGNPFCGRIARDLDNGEITLIRQFETNSDQLQTRGIDFAAQYRAGLAGLGLPGELEIEGNATHVLEYEVTRLGETFDLRNSLADGAAYKWRVLGSLSWRHADFRLRYQVEYFSSILDSRARLLDYQEVLEEVPGAEEPLFLRYPEVWEHSINGSYEFDVGDGELRLLAGINNLFDDISPFAPDGDVETGRRANFNRMYDVRGRRFYVGAELTF